MFGIKTRYKRLQKRFTKKALILMYHSISKPEIDPWELSVSPANFEQQLQVLQKRYSVSSVQDIVSGQQKGKLKNSIAITFDDGYRNNFVTAKPLLEKYKLPATFFITSKSFDEGYIFWWDKLANIILKTPVLPGRFSMEIRNQNVDLSIEEESHLNENMEQLHQRWIYTDNPPTKRSTLYHRLWQLMQPLSPGEIGHVLGEIETWAGKEIPIINNEYRLMTKDQLKALADYHLFEIGLHTVNHVALGYQLEEAQKQEIIQNQKDLEQIIQKKVTTIAYPYGDYNSRTLEIAEKVGLKAGFSVEYNLVFSFSNPFDLGRFQVKNWNGKQFEDKLIKWLNQ